MSVFDGHLWRRITIADGLPSDQVFDVLEDSTGKVWAATAGGICTFDGTTWSRVNIPQELWGSIPDTSTVAPNTVFSWMIARDSKGKLFFTSYFGILSFDGTQWKLMTKADGLETNNVATIGFDHLDRLWCGYYSNKVGMFDGRAWSNFSLQIQVSNPSIGEFLEDSRGDIWFATNGGLFRYNGTEWTSFTDQQGLPSSYIYTVAEDSSGNIWCGTVDGAARYDGSRWETFNHLNGLVNDNVTSIAVDGMGYLWFGTYFGGISMTDPDPPKLFIDDVVRIEDENADMRSSLPIAFSLSQNYPNPFNPSTTITFTVPDRGLAKVNITVYNLRGVVIKELENRVRAPGAYSVNWDGRDSRGQIVASGVYFYRLRAGGYVSTRKMVLLK